MIRASAASAPRDAAAASGLGRGMRSVADPSSEKAPSPARLVALAGRHPLPALVIAQHVLALRRRQLLKAPITPQQLLLAFGR